MHVYACLCVCGRLCFVLCLFDLCSLLFGFVMVWCACVIFVFVVVVSNLLLLFSACVVAYGGSFVLCL